MCKVTVEVEAPFGGVIKAFHAEVGDAVEVVPSVDVHHVERSVLKAGSSVNGELPQQRRALGVAQFGPLTDQLVDMVESSLIDHTLLVPGFPFPSR